MKPGPVALLLAAALALPAQAQWREYLGDEEIREIREAQEPDKRLNLYVEFARRRLGAVEEELAGAKAGAKEGRGGRINTSLWEYDRIIDAIDDNVEQAVERRELVRKGLEQVLEAEPEFLKLLESFRARNPKDLRDYRFILGQALDTTQASMQRLQQVHEKLPKGKEEKKKRKQEERQD